MPKGVQCCCEDITLKLTLNEKLLERQLIDSVVTPFLRAVNVKLSQRFFGRTVGTGDIATLEVDGKAVAGWKTAIPSELFSGDSPVLRLKLKAYASPKRILSSKDGSAANEHGRLFSPPVGWPQSYKTNEKLKDFLLGKLKAKRIRVVAAPKAEDVQEVTAKLAEAGGAGVDADEDDGNFGRALAINRLLGWPIIAGFACYQQATSAEEEEEEPRGTGSDGTGTGSEGEAVLAAVGSGTGGTGGTGGSSAPQEVFVGVERWWNAKPTGPWVDFSPRTDADSSVVLLESSLCQNPAGAIKAAGLAAADDADAIANRDVVDTPEAREKLKRELLNKYSGLAIAYRPGFNDGFGAQLQRLLAIYAICREFKYDYVHTPLVDIEYQGLQSLLEGRNSPKFVEECNAFVSTYMRSDVDVSFAGKTHEAIDNDLSLEQLDNVKMTFLAMTKGKQAPFVAPRPVDDSPEAKREAEKKLVKASREFLAGVKAEFLKPAPLVRMSLPYGIADAHPHVYRHVRGLFRRRASSAASSGAAAASSSGAAAAARALASVSLGTAGKGGEEEAGAPRTLVIGLHVRRGELFVVDSDRMLPNSHYISIAQRVARACAARGVAYRFELYSEVAKSPKVVSEFPGTGKQLATPKTFDASLNQLEDFDVLEPHLTRCLNEPLLTSKLRTAIEHHVSSASAPCCAPPRSDEIPAGTSSCTPALAPLLLHPCSAPLLTPHRLRSRISVAVCPTLVCPTLVCPTLVCPTLVCPTLVCPTLVCPTLLATSL